MLTHLHCVHLIACPPLSLSSPLFQQQGTVLSGTIKINDTIEIASLRIEKKIKSIQMFRKPVQAAGQGDRVGMCVASLDAALIERGLATTPGTVPTVHACIAYVRKIRFFKGNSVLSCWSWLVVRCCFHYLF